MVFKIANVRWDLAMRSQREFPVPNEWMFSENSLASMVVPRR